MKRIIATLIAGIVLGSTSVAAAGIAGGWHTLARNVQCKGSDGSVMCMTTNRANLYGGAYSVYISDCSVALWQERANGSIRTVIERWQPSCR